MPAKIKINTTTINKTYFNGDIKKYIKKIKQIETREVDIGSCETCVVQDLMLALGVDLCGDPCGGSHLFQRFFPFCPTSCSLTQLVANDFINATRCSRCIDI